MGSGQPVGSHEHVGVDKRQELSPCFVASRIASLDESQAFIFGLYISAILNRFERFAHVSLRDPTSLGVWTGHRRSRPTVDQTRHGSHFVQVLWSCVVKYVLHTTRDTRKRSLRLVQQWFVERDNDHTKATTKRYRTLLALNGRRKGVWHDGFTVVVRDDIIVQLLLRVFLDNR